MRDLRSIFYKQTNLNNTMSGNTSARNRSSTKILSKASSKSLKGSRRSSNKKMRGSHKEDRCDETFHSKMMNVTNGSSNSKSLIRGTKLRKKRVEKSIPDGVKKINIDKIRFKSPKAHSLGKKKLSKIKFSGRGNKFMTNNPKNNMNNSNINSVRSKGGVVSGSKDSKNKSIKVVKKDYILKQGQGKLRFSSKVKERMSSNQKVPSKNPSKGLKKISPNRTRADKDPSNFKIALDRVVQYNNF